MEISCYDLERQRCIISHPGGAVNSFEN